MKIKLEYDTNSSELNLGLYGNNDKLQDEYNVLKQTYETNIATNAGALQNSIMPAAIRYVNLATGVILFERPPCYVPFNFSNVYQATRHADAKSEYRLNLPIPWQRYVLFLAHNGMPIKIHVFFANGPITSLTDDPLSYAPLPNLYEDCSVCLPQFEHVDMESFDLISAISNAYNIVWKTGFNADILKAYQLWASKTPTTNLLYKDIRVTSGHMDRFYKRWANFTLEEVASSNWITPLYPSFDWLVQHFDYSSIDTHERVVDIFLAARN